MKKLFTNIHISNFNNKFLNCLDPYYTNSRFFFLLKRDLREHCEKEEIKDICTNKESIKSLQIINNNICETKEKLLKENLKQYTLFNIYLDKIKKTEKTKKIININSVKYFDDYINLFDLEPLLIYTNNKFKIFKKKKCLSGIDLFHFFKIFIQFNTILNDFFFYKNEKKCNEYFISVFLPYLKNIGIIKKFEEHYDENFYLKVLQIIKIFNHIDFINKLKNVNINTLRNQLHIEARHRQLLRRKNPKEEFTKEKDESHLFYECMSYEEKEHNYNSDLDFIKNVKLFDKTYDVKYIENYFYYKDKGIKRNHNAFLNSDENNYINNEIEKFYYFNKEANENNKLINNDLTQEGINNDNLNQYLELVKGFSYLLKNFIKYLSDDGVARLFMSCSKIFGGTNIEEVISFYKKMYEKIKKMKNITNKNLAYILNGCNYYLKEENFYLIKHLKVEILHNSYRNNKKNNLNIYNIAPSHLENIIYTLSKNNVKDKKLFLLFSEIIREKCEGFSCIISINILNSYSLLNYEMLIFDYIYEKIKSFDFITFMMCKGNNIIKLINTLLQIEFRNFLKKYNSNIILKKSKIQNTTSWNSSVNEKCTEENTIEKNISTLTDEFVYVTLIIALLYEQKTFKRSILNENAILDIYKRLLRLHIIKIKNKKDFDILKDIFKKNYKDFCIKEFDKFFVFSFINLNLDKINFHKLIFTLLKYNNSICEKKSTINYIKKKKKFFFGYTQKTYKITN